MIYPFSLCLFILPVSNLFFFFNINSERISTVGICSFFKGEFPLFLSMKSCQFRHGDHIPHNPKTKMDPSKIYFPEKCVYLQNRCENQ